MATTTLLHVQIEALARGLCQPQEIVDAFWDGIVLDKHQHDIIRYILLGLTGQFAEVAIKGCAGSGKSFAAALAANIWYEYDQQSKIIFTGPRYETAKKVMFGEFKVWRRKMKARCKDTILDAIVHSGDKRYAVVLNSESGEGFSGQHGGKILFVFDEASAVPHRFWSIALSQAHMRVAISNPRTSSTWFRRLFPDDKLDEAFCTVEVAGGSKRACITVSGENCINVKAGKEIIPGQITRATYEALIAESDEVTRWALGYGKFPPEDAEVNLIMPSWLKRHTQAWREDIPITAVGIDVADSEHGDATVIAFGSSDGVTKLVTQRRSNLMATTQYILTIADRNRVDIRTGGVPVVVDADGSGKGVADRLAELGVWVIPHKGSASAFDARQFANRRAESYGILARRLDPRDNTEPWALPEDHELLEELCAPEKIVLPDGVRFKLQPKRLPAGASPPRNHKGEVVQTVFEKLRRSPDKADAVAYLSFAIYVAEGGLQEPEQPAIVSDDELVAIGSDSLLESAELDLEDEYDPNDDLDQYFSELQKELAYLDKDEDDDKPGTRRNPQRGIRPGHSEDYD